MHAGEKRKVWGPLSSKHANDRDTRVTFDEIPHLYYVDGATPTQYISVTTHLKKFVPEFDAEAVLNEWYPKWQQNPQHRYFGKSREQILTLWEDIRNSASSLGTKMHAQIEAFMNGELEEDPNTSEWRLFMKYHEEHGSLFEPYRVEWRVFSEKYKIAGSMDMVYRFSNGTLGIYDWKRSKKLSTDAFMGHKMLEPVEDLDDCNYQHYCLQLNLYRRLLEENYGETVSAMRLAVFHPNKKHYQLFDVPFLDAHIDAILAYRELELSLSQK